MASFNTTLVKVLYSWQTDATVGFTGFNTTLVKVLLSLAVQNIGCADVSIQLLLRFYLIHK